MLGNLVQHITCETAVTVFALPALVSQLALALHKICSHLVFSFFFIFLFLLLLDLTHGLVLAAVRPLAEDMRLAVLTNVSGGAFTPEDKY